MEREEGKLRKRLEGSVTTAEEAFKLSRNPRPDLIIAGQFESESQRPP